MTSYSIYRAQSPQGIGEGPGKPATGPDQYVWASPELWRDQALLDALRPWMTLKFQAQHRFERNSFQESWSCCVLHGYLFVARLTLDETDRYFTHARAWKVEELAPGFDPGALMCRGEAFDSPGDPLGVSMAPAPLMTWQDLLQEHKERVARFIAHLYAARLGRRPLVVLSESYRSNETIFRILALARAALPLALRRTCAVRIYTREAASFLKDLSAGVVVMPTEALEGVIAAQPHLTLLTSAGAPMHGPVVDESWGAMVVRRAQKFPEALFGFADRCTPGLPVAVAQMVYNLAVATGNPEWMDELLETKLYGSASSPEIVPPSEWNQFSQQVLQRLALNGAGHGQVDPWRERVRAEIRNRKVTLDGALEKWWSAQEPAQRGRALLDLLDTKLISSQAAATYARQLSGPEFVELGRRTEWWRLSQVAGDSPLPEAWAVALAESNDPWPTLMAAMEATRQTAAWKRLTWTAFQELLRRDRLPSGNAIGSISRLPFPQAPHEKLLVAELYHRVGLSAATQRLKAVEELVDRESRRWVVKQLGDPLYKCLTGFKIPEHWLPQVDDLVKVPAAGKVAEAPGAMAAPAAPAKGAEAKASPAKASPTVAAPVKGVGAAPVGPTKAVDAQKATGTPLSAEGVRAEEAAAGLDESFVRAIVRQVKPGQSVPPLKQRLLDRWMLDQPRITTRACLDTACWSDWRNASGLTWQQLRVCAVNWLLDPAPASGRTWHDWKQVMADLGPASITESELREWIQVKPVLWPWFPGRTVEQLEDLAKAARPEAQGLLKTTRGSTGTESAAAPAEKKADAAKPASRATVRPPSAPPQPSPASKASTARPAPESAQGVAAGKAQAPTAANFVFQTLVAQPEKQVAELSRLRLWEDQTFQKRLAEWLLSKPVLTANAVTVLNRSLPPQGSAETAATPPLPGMIVPLKAAAEKHLREDYLGIAEFLWPRIGRGQLDLAMLQALSWGESAAACWNVLARDMAWELAHSGVHLLQGVVARIRKADRPTMERLGGAGWNTLRDAVSKYPVLLSLGPNHTMVLPALEVAALAREQDPMVKIGLDLIALADAQLLGSPWWWNALMLGMAGLPRRSGLPHPKDTLVNALGALADVAKGLSPEARAAFAPVLNVWGKSVPEMGTAGKSAEAVRKGGAALRPPLVQAATPASAGTESSEQQLCHDLIQALVVGDADSACWEAEALRVRNEPTKQHPWHLLAQTIAQYEPDVLVQLQNGGWETLEIVLREYPDLMKTAGQGRSSDAEIPARAIATVLRPNKSKVVVAQDLVLLNPAGEYLLDEEWWKGLFRGLHPQTATSLARGLEPKLEKVKAREAMHRARSRGTV